MQTLPIENFTLQEVNKSGLRTKLIKSTMQRDGKLLVMTSIRLRSDFNRNKLYLNLLRLNRDGTEDLSFRTDVYFSSNNIEVPRDIFLFVNND